MTSDFARPVTWHYGLMARWWSEFMTDGPEIAYFQQLIARFGAPALDAGCGTGRLLIPALQAGFDVDGSDVSADMLAQLQQLARTAGFEPALYCQAMHELDLPRRYRTIFACGAIGIGGGRAPFHASLTRLHDQLEPGGVVAINEVNPRPASTWPRMVERMRAQGVPEAWPQHGDRRRLADGSELELITRLGAVDADDQTVTREMRLRHWRGKELIAEEANAVIVFVYHEDETTDALGRAGFTEVWTEDGYAVDQGMARVVLARR
jgi:SAM-dependent methyltransferase